MANNFSQEGDVLTVTNSTAAAIASGIPIQIGMSQLGIALVDLAISASGSVATEGIYTLSKAAGVITQGQKLWWAPGAANVVNAPEKNAFFIGYAAAAELTGATTVNVILEEFDSEGPRVLTLAATGAQTLTAADLLGGDLIILATNTAAQTLNLPSVTLIPPGTKLFVKKISGGAYALTIDPAGSETIAGGTTLATIDADNDLAQFISTGAAWVLLTSTIA